MAQLSDDEMKRRMALLMLYTAYVSRLDKCACAKGAFGREMEGILAAGYACEFSGGWMMTNRGAEHWEVEITKVAAKWQALNQVQLDILAALSTAPLDLKSREPRVKAQDLPHYKTEPRWPALCKALCTMHLADRFRGHDRVRYYKITGRGMNCLRRAGLEIAV